MKIQTRKEAMQTGMKKYWTGKPCRNGHLTLRYTNTGVCIDCAATHSSNQWQKVRHPSLRSYTSVRIKCHRDDIKLINEFAQALIDARALGC